MAYHRMGKMTGMCGGVQAHESPAAKDKVPTLKIGGVTTKEPPTLGKGENVVKSPGKGKKK